MNAKAYLCLLLGVSLYSLTAQSVYKKGDLIQSRQGQVVLYRLASSEELISGQVKIIENTRRHTLATLQNGILNGRYEEYLHGKLALAGSYTKGMREGKWVEYYPSEAVRRESHYAEGRLAGEVISYFGNGRVEKKLYYQANMRHGKEQIFDQSGAEIAHYNWQNDQKEGQFVSCTDQGQGMTTKTVGAYRANQLHGAWRCEVFVSGKLTYIIDRVYEYGTIKSEQTTKK